MELAININKLAQKDPLHLSKANDSFYKVCSRYLGFLTEKMMQYFAAKSYTKISTTSSLTVATFLFKKGTSVWKIKNILSQENSKNFVALLTITLEKENLTALEGYLKNLGIPSGFVSLVN